VFQRVCEGSIGHRRIAGTIISESQILSNAQLYNGFASYVLEFSPQKGAEEQCHYD
jgi:hypothetical protein